MLPERPEVPIFVAEKRFVKALPGGLVPIMGVTEGAETTGYGYGGAEVPASLLAEAFTTTIGKVVPGACTSKVSVEGVSIVAVEVRVWPMTWTITVVDRISDALPTLG